MLEYHDCEWGVLTRDDRRHFEFLVLESAQAGLSWQTVLARRSAYREAFANFDPAVVATYGASELSDLLANRALIRNRAKLESAINNAAAFLQLCGEFGSFFDYLTDLLGPVPVANRFESPEDIPAATSRSKLMSQDLARRGFRFIGPIVAYSHLQATGVVMDHLVHCFRYEQLIFGAGPEPRQNTTGVWPIGEASRYDGVDEG